MQETLITAKEYNLKLIYGLERFVDSIENEQLNEALQLLSEIIEGMEWLIQATNLTDEIQKEKLDVNELNQNLVAMTEALENQDYMLLTDIVNYEIIAKLQNWHQLNFSN